MLQVQQFRWLERVQSFHGTYVQSPDGEVGPPHMCSFSGDQEFVQQVNRTFDTVVRLPLTTLLMTSSPKLD